MPIPTGASSDSAMSPKYGSWPGCQALLRLRIPPKNLLKSGTLRYAPVDFLVNSCNLQQRKRGTQFLVSAGCCTQHLISLTAAPWPFPPTEDFAYGLNLFSRVFDCFCKESKKGIEGLRMFFGKQECCTSLLRCDWMHRWEHQNPGYSLIPKLPHHFRDCAVAAIAVAFHTEIWPVFW